ncbi:hypothetical protein [Mesorhizobium sp. A623]
MVQPILFFALGFLGAGFLALLVAPAIWRRAVSLTRARIQGSMPLTLSEIQADKDSMRAEFAMATRKLEMTVGTLREKAAGQMVEIGRSREQLAALETERAAHELKIAAQEQANEALTVMARKSEEQVGTLSARLADSERLAEEAAQELERLGQMYDEASFAASNRQIELVARESRLQGLTDEMSSLRTQHKDALRRQKEIEVEHRLSREAIDAERKKASDLDKKVARLMATLADRDEKLDRREKEIERLREQSKGVAPAAANPRREADIEKAIGKLDVARERLEARLVALARENKQLRTDVAAAQQAHSPGDEAGDASMLREQMHDLAAEVVQLTALLDGPDSPISKALAAPQVDQASGQQGERMMSLADRVRALQKAAAEG